jgi:hypothetical protein
MIKTTKAQRKALFALLQRDFPSYVTPTRRHEGVKCPHCGEWSKFGTVRMPSAQYRNLRRQVIGLWGSDDCIMVPRHGQWYGIEPDGYTHT